MRLACFMIFLIFLSACLSACGAMPVPETGAPPHLLNNAVFLFDLLIFIILLAAVLLVCVVMLVPKTSDPHQKLNDAVVLFHKQKRPLRAERLIREASEIFQKNNDRLGLAGAYQIYGFFFRSLSVKKWQKVYRQHGFLDESADYDSRLVKAIEYFEKAKAIFTEINSYDGLTNVNYNLGVTYEYMNNPLLACKAYEQSLSSYRDNLRQNPDAKVALPDVFSNYEEFEDYCNRRLGCKREIP